jgi:hypothetical protein
MFIGALVAVLAVVLAGGLVASNMGFKLNYTLIAAGQAVPEGGVSKDGTNTYNYPYHSVAATANDLRLEIGAPANGGITKLLRATNSTQTYTGKGTGLNFNLVPGAAYTVRITGTSNVSFVPNHY